VSTAHTIVNISMNVQCLLDHGGSMFPGSS